MTDFRMPSLGADMEDGKLVEWLVGPGSRVGRGDIVAVVETHKGAIDIEIFEDGVVAQLCARTGDTVPVGGLLARIARDGETLDALPEGTAPHRDAPQGATALPAPPLPAPSQTLAANGRQSGRPKASPAARRLAASLGIDPGRLQGTGVEGAVTFADVELAQTGGATPQAPESPVERRAGFDPVAMRHAIATAMSRSKREIPHYYLTTTVDMTAALAWLAEWNAQRPPGERMLAAALLMKATALALRKAPQFNGFWQDGTFVPGDGIHVGWAISLRGGGLVAPAIRHADTLPLEALMERLRDLVARARAGGLRSSEIIDPTITVTSLGERGADGVIGVIYPPQVAILGFGRIATRPWVVDGKVEPRSLVAVSLAADHRASDGHAGGLFLSAIEQLLLEPEKL